MLEFITFATSHFINVCTPGPGFLLITETSVMNGRRVGRITVFILSLAYFIQMIFTLLTLHFGLSQNPYLMNYLNIGGFIFLTNFAIRTARNNKVSHLTKNSLKKAEKITFQEMFPSIFTYGILNMKSLSSYFVFVGILAPANMRYLYAAWIITMSLSYNLCIVQFLTIEKIRMKYVKHALIINRIATLMLFGLAASVLKKVNFDYIFFKR